MKITFSIEYHTHWGEELFLMLGNDRYSALKMYYTPGDMWTVTLDVSNETLQLRYRYMVKEGGEVTRVEQSPYHSLSLDGNIAHYLVEDCWDDNGDRSAADDFIARLMGGDEVVAPVHYKAGCVIVEAMVSTPHHGVKPAIVGEAQVLGAWNVRKAIALQPCGESLWKASLSVSANHIPTQYKLIILGKRGDVQWESGENRWLKQTPHHDEVILVRGLRFRNDGDVRPLVATLVELAALRSERDMGIGDLGDLKKVLQWVSATGQSAVLINSIADRTIVEGWMPVDMRNRVMENAADPIFISVSELGSISDKKLMAQFQKKGMELNALDGSPLDEVRALKLAYCHEVFAENGAAVTRTATYRKFVNENAAWLRPYAAQMILKRVNGTTDFTAWGNYGQYNPEQIERFLRARHHEYRYICYLQYQLRQQLMTMARYAQSKKVSLFCSMSEPRHVKYLDPKEPWVNQRFLEQRLRESGRMALIPLRDWLLIDGDYLQRVTKTSQRLPVSLEELIATHDFNARIKSIMASR